MTRYADDLVLGFQHRTDAERFLGEFRERLAKFGLVHPDKTRLIEFGRFAARDRKRRAEGKPETFNFLGFSVLQKCTCIERAKEMLRAPAARVLDVATACGFKTQQHFAQVFRDICGLSPTEYRQDFVGSEVTCASETCSEDTPRLVICGSQPQRHSHGCPSLPCKTPVLNL